jgi:hypothetical protein
LGADHAQAKAARDKERTRELILNYQIEREGVREEEATRRRLKEEEEAVIALQQNKLNAGRVQFRREAEEKKCEVRQPTFNRELSRAEVSYAFAATLWCKLLASPSEL